MQELVPIGFGLLAGAFLGSFSAGGRPWLGLVLSIVLGGLATFVTGEFRVSMAFVLIDIPLVAISAGVAYLALRQAALRRRPRA